MQYTVLYLIEKCSLASSAILKLLLFMRSAPYSILLHTAWYCYGLIWVGIVQNVQVAIFIVAQDENV
jgi:hypothetical protein